MSSRLLSAQLLITLVVAAAASAFGLVPGCSALVGGLVSVAANTYFAHRVLHDGQSRSAGQVLLVIYLAEVVKIALAVVLIVALCTVFEGINVMALVAGFFVVHVGGSMALALQTAPEALPRTLR